MARGGSVWRCGIKDGRGLFTNPGKRNSAGVMIDFNFKGYACEKAATSNLSLVRLMPNIGGPRYNRRSFVAGLCGSLNAIF